MVASIITLPLGGLHDAVEILLHQFLLFGGAEHGDRPATGSRRHRICRRHGLVGKCGGEQIGCARAGLAGGFGLDTRSTRAASRIQPGRTLIAALCDRAGASKNGADVVRQHGHRSLLDWLATVVDEELRLPCCWPRSCRFPMLPAPRGGDLGRHAERWRWCCGRREY